MICYSEFDVIEYSFNYLQGKGNDSKSSYANHKRLSFDFRYLDLHPLNPSPLYAFMCVIRKTSHLKKSTIITLD